MCEREALEVEFVIKKFRSYLLFSDKLMVLSTYHQEMQSAFYRKDMNSRLFRSLELFAEYRF